METPAQTTTPALRGIDCWVNSITGEDAKRLRSEFLLRVAEDYFHRAEELAQGRRVNRRPYRDSRPSARSGWAVATSRLRHIPQRAQAFTRLSIELSGADAASGSAKLFPSYIELRHKRGDLFVAPRA